MKREVTERPGSIVIRVVADNDSIITGSPSECSTVTNVVLNVADHSSLGDRSDRQDVSDYQIGLLPTVDELAGVNSLRRNEQLILLLVPEGVTEADSGQRSSAARIVDDLGDDALEVAVSLAKVEGPEPGRTLAVVSVGLEDGPGTLTLSSDDATHLETTVRVSRSLLSGREIVF